MRFSTSSACPASSASASTRSRSASRAAEDAASRHVGGTAEAALRRAARLGNGWYGVEDPALLPILRKELERAGRDPTEFEISLITLGGPLAIERLEELAGLGVGRVVVTPWPGRKVAEVGREGLDELERYAREIGLA